MRLLTQIYAVDPLALCKAIKPKFFPLVSSVSAMSCYQLFFQLYVRKFVHSLINHPLLKVRSVDHLLPLSSHSSGALRKLKRSCCL
ncbi:hypothetical protein P153DRAFT_179198 [Dothidotthia symphoricarpi CBS 119687]|uniref:Uncharacterized protein n=1 Tax=Dothidotthia symphoricarpi CBS 119687 TaxID=1392245 RepID=A0A6A6AMC0_9PLEO|nr:uncharacterized protein P153DRAFT_179198 [Dothidotthia symphoricarpi CBS 119687]KAF2133079.1 hypothetical protein P153DRAFT_179198 [Dothidotthia symphoricarpi CBS 119687]